MAELERFALSIGAPAPDFGLPGVDGKIWKLSDFADARLLVVAFWCNHCPYVQAWEGRTIDLAREFADRQVRFVAINANDARSYPDDRFDRMVERAKSKGYPFPYLHDESQSVAKAYGALVTPHPMLFDAERRLLYQGRIDDNHQDARAVRHRFLHDAIEAALQGRAVEPATRPVLGCSVKWKG